MFIVNCIFCSSQSLGSENEGVITSICNMHRDRKVTSEMLPQSPSVVLVRVKFSPSSSSTNCSPAHPHTLTSLALTHAGKLKNAIPIWCRQQTNKGKRIFLPLHVYLNMVEMWLIQCPFYKEEYVKSIWNCPRPHIYSLIFILSRAAGPGVNKPREAPPGCC